jgi:anti-sigma regulatory factor (Ser/Thr protein kinase)
VTFTTYADDPSSVRQARHDVRAALAARATDDAIETAVLIVSELATNALTHGAGGFSVEVVVDDKSDEALISVRDAGRGVPTPRPAVPGTPGGHGLNIVGALTAAWGVERLPSGKRVWARVRLRPGRKTPGG